MNKITETPRLYHYIMEDLSDPRTADWFMVRSPVPLFLSIAVYLYLVKMGPVWMQSRKPYDLKNIMIFYNFCMVTLSAYMFYETLVTAWLNPDFSKVCQPVDYSNNPQALRLANVIWLYYISKLIEFLDTVFFVLRKKNNQITFLHVYHHASMPFWYWQGAKFVSGGESYLVVSLNSFIHVIMYTYYLLAAFGPSMQKYLWWKKHMTKLQLIQFVWFVLHALHTLYIGCGFPRAYLMCQLLVAFSQLVLFLNFYTQTYSKSNQRENQVSSNGISTEKKLS
ncbi:elongation of very long chain fatty acids protein AAEL008004-like [Saccostrea echinata]|uniref:elongation of very long chain fatty acids protein AAEL008004-like n=1 Tax=Saccostrea echinata TaxID=191078 RepID=UPI002A7FD082|nr:elongation of very long chain fatty acids protein AAEL008004-like [Saccostrea echinata]